MDFARCFKENENCMGVHDLDDQFNSAFGFFSELYDQGSLINEAITKNLRCLNETFRTSICMGDVRYDLVDNGVRLDDGEEQDAEVDCMQDSVDVLLAKMGMYNLKPEERKEMAEFFQAILDEVNEEK
ncbi:hypothetical protein CDAR_563421 [Caerostris darwini]|uniref:Uncharacterized protein n=1 Tax=Caerostris darwini TaxID=1538125 RepID=A0AAV4WIB9_9ARAC|nr:hypothetical protein CDAR_563421 [Caerostris darwini]